MTVIIGHKKNLRAVGGLPAEAVVGAIYSQVPGDAGLPSYILGRQPEPRGASECFSIILIGILNNHT